MIEIRHISEAAIQHDIQYRRWFSVRRVAAIRNERAERTGVALAGELLKNAKKMVSAEFRLPCEGAKRLVEIRAAFNHSNDSPSPRLCSRRARVVGGVVLRDFKSARGLVRR
jgi:hypothetical protein